MEEWGIPRENVLTMITDNGSNMVASFHSHTHAEVATTSEEDSEAEHNDGDEQEGEDDRSVCV